MVRLSSSRPPPKPLSVKRSFALTLIEQLPRPLSEILLLSTEATELPLRPSKAQAKKLVASAVAPSTSKDNLQMLVHKTLPFSWVSYQS
jgi:hypothetical protein